jgi:hypothetical protein
MLTSQQCLRKYGPPSDGNPHMVMWDVPGFLEIGMIPKRIYCNRDLVQPLSRAFQELIRTGHVNELKTWDGCFNIRKKRGGSTMSLHSWGVAVDLNAYANCFGCRPQLSPGFVKCFTNNGFDWGGTWRKPDGMHFQLKTI